MPPSLTKLTWSQPLTASIRLALLTDLQYSQIDPDDDLTASGPVSDQHLFEVMNSALSALHATPSDRKLQLHYGNDEIQYSIGTILRLQRVVTDELYDRYGLEHRSRAGALWACLLIELGWPIKVVASVLRVSRPTLFKWVDAQVNTPMDYQELTDLREILAGTDAEVDPFPLGSALIDIRRSRDRTRISGLSWQKADFLPTPEIADIMRALWRIGLRVRGERSMIDERACGYVLDIMIDLLMRRGVTGQNIGKIVGVTHAAVLHRWMRSRLWEPDDEFGTQFWVDGEAIGTMSHGIVKPDSAGDLDLSWDTADLYHRTSVHTRLRTGGAPTADVLLCVRTSPVTEATSSPAPNVYMLAAPVGVHPDVLDELGSVAAGDAELTLRNAVKATPGASFEPHQVPTDQVPGLRYIQALRGVLESHGNWDDLPGDPPWDDKSLISELYDIKPYNYSGIVDRHTEWGHGTLFSEALLFQATGQYNRDEVGCGFGHTTYHWVPAEAFPSLVEIVPHSDVPARLVELSDPERMSNPDDLRQTLEQFLPAETLKMVDAWVAMSEGGEGDGKDTLLSRCLLYPAHIVTEYDKPQRRAD